MIDDISDDEDDAEHEAEEVVALRSLEFIFNFCSLLLFSSMMKQAKVRRYEKKTFLPKHERKKLTIH